MLSNQPNFLCVGAEKSGTTYLYHLLMQHRDIFIPKNKELYFFADDKWYEKGFKKYLKNFSQVNNEKRIGDITPVNMSKLFCAKRIFQHLGSDLKIIFLLRDPIYRAYSGYRMKYEKRKISISFEDIVNNEIKNNPINYNSIIGKGVYIDQINNFLNLYPREQMKIVKFEEFVKYPEETIKEICRFLEVNDNIQINTEMPKNEKHQTRVNLFGKIFYMIPLTIRRRFRKVYYLINKEKRNRILFSQKKINDDAKLNDETIAILKDYYKPYSVLLQEQYNFSIKGWT